MTATMTVLGCMFLAACSVGDPTTAPAVRTGLRCTDCQEVRVFGVVDGDTLDTSIGRIRLFGVDTPERGDRCYREATERLQEIAGETIRVESGPRAADGFNRNLYYVYTAAGFSIDEVLIAEGLGLAWTWDGQHRDGLIAVEVQASSLGAGCLW